MQPRCHRPPFPRVPCRVVVSRAGASRPDAPRTPRHSHVAHRAPSASSSSSPSTNPAPSRATQRWCAPALGRPAPATVPATSYQHQHPQVAMPRSPRPFAACARPHGRARPKRTTALPRFGRRSTARSRGAASSRWRAALTLTLTLTRTTRTPTARPRP